MITLKINNTTEEIRMCYFLKTFHSQMETFGS
jgi:hypothetical protein